LTRRPPPHPPLADGHGRREDTQGDLGKILEILRFSAEVLEARERRWQEERPPSVKDEETGGSGGVTDWLLRTVMA